MDLRPPEIQTSAAEQALLPALLKISVSGFAGDEIVKILKARYDKGLPLRDVRIGQAVDRVGSGVSYALGGFEGPGGYRDGSTWTPIRARAVFKPVHCAKCGLKVSGFRDRPNARLC